MGNLTGEDFVIAFESASEPDEYVCVFRSEIAGFLANPGDDSITLLLTYGDRYPVKHTTQQFIEAAGVRLVHCERQLEPQTQV